MNRVKRLRKRKNSPDRYRKFVLSTTDRVPGHEITEILGVVSASSVMVASFSKDLMVGVRGIVGGEVSQYTELLDETRFKALEKLKEAARNRRSHALINVRFSTNSISVGFVEVLAYGTAVLLKPVRKTRTVKERIPTELKVAPTDPRFDAIPYTARH